MKRSYQYSDYEQEYKKNIKIVEKFDKDYLDSFQSNIYSLNSNLVDLIKEKIKENPSIDLSGIFSNFLSYLNYIEKNYLLPPKNTYSFGSGDCGQLAHGVENDKDMLVKYPRKVLSLEGKNLVNVSCGGLHNAAVTSSGEVYTWGCADDGSLGRVAGEDGVFAEDIPTPIKLPVKILKISCGDGQTLALSIDGDVFGWGSYKDKEGKKWFNLETSTSPLKSMKRQQDTPIKILGLSNILDISCASAVNYAYGYDGNLYSWGISECGELSRYTPSIKDADGEYIFDVISEYHLKPAPVYFADASDEQVITKFKNLKDANYSMKDFNKDIQRKKVTGVKSFTCKGWHAVIVLNNDEVYSVGLNNYGQLALDDESIRYFFTKSSSLSNQEIKEVKAGLHYTLALKENGEVLAVGRADTGQLGNDEINYQNPGDFSNKPVKVKFPAGVKISDISCGDSHSLAISTTKEDGSNDVYSWGFGEMCALGNGKDEDAIVPTLVKFKGGVKTNTSVVAAGGQHSVILSSEL